MCIFLYFSDTYHPQFSSSYVVYTDIHLIISIIFENYSPFRLMKTASIYECSDCGSILGFSPSTLCLRCYDVIRTKTLEIKRRMMNYNPYIGERQTPQPTYKEEEESKHIESERLKIERIDDENNKSKLIER